MRSLLILAAVFAALIGSPAFVSAHVEVVSSDPANGARLERAPDTITLKFNDELASEGAKLTVTDAWGRVVDRGNGAVDLSDIERKTMIVSLKDGLGAGDYTIAWSVLGDDGHEIAGTLAFTVNAAPLQPTPATSSTANSPTAPATINLPATGGNELTIARFVVGLGIIGAGLLLRQRALKA